MSPSAQASRYWQAYGAHGRRHAEELLRAGGSLQGVGIQYYADGRNAKEIGSSRHSPARIAQVLQNPWLNLMTHCGSRLVSWLNLMTHCGSRLGVVV